MKKIVIEITDDDIRVFTSDPNMQVEVIDWTEEGTVELLNTRRADGSATRQIIDQHVVRSTTGLKELYAQAHGPDYSTIYK